MSALLEVADLRVEVAGHDSRPLTLVDGVSFTVGAGEVVGIAGESGSGKTQLALALLGLNEQAATVGGSALFDGRELLGLPERERRKVRGREVAMVFQDPMASLHPMRSVRQQLTDHVRHHEGVSRKAADARALELLRQVRLPDPAAALRAYPHQFSGGMRQRLAIAIALACRPRLLIADEPTTALDVTTQAGVLRLLLALRAELGMSVIFVSHDLGLMSAAADRLVVLYAGRVVEQGPAGEVLAEPRHPYTRGLLAALPKGHGRRDAGLHAIPGTPATPARRPAGCAFHPRCGLAAGDCAVAVPELRPSGAGRAHACAVVGTTSEETVDARA